MPSSCPSSAQLAEAERARRRQRRERVRLDAAGASARGAAKSQSLAPRAGERRLADALRRRSAASARRREPAAARRPPRRPSPSPAGGSYAGPRSAPPTSQGGRSRPPRPRPRAGTAARSGSARAAARRDTPRAARGAAAGRAPAVRSRTGGCRSRSRDAGRAARRRPRARGRRRRVPARTGPAGLALAEHRGDPLERVFRRGPVQAQSRSSRCTSKWMSGSASAALPSHSLTWPHSVDRRFQELAPGRHGAEELVHLDPGSLRRGGGARLDPPAGLDPELEALLAPARAGERRRRETEAMAGSASPRKPKLWMSARLGARASLLVAWRSSASAASLRRHAPAVVDHAR